MTDVPLLVMMRDQADDQPSELDVCTACRDQSTLIVWFRLHDELVGLCSECIDELTRGYAELLRQRSVHRARRL